MGNIKGASEAYIEKQKLFAEVGLFNAVYEAIQNNIEPIEHHALTLGKEMLSGGNRTVQVANNKHVFVLMCSFIL